MTRDSLSYLRATLILSVLSVVDGTTSHLRSQQENGSPATIEERTRDMVHWEGFFDLYWDEQSGRLFWEIDRLGTEFLYQVSLATGLGSNPVGLDRGQLGRTLVLRAERMGPKIFLIEPNYRYRASSDNAEEVRAVEEAFAPSTHWGFEIEAQTEDRILVDATAFFLRDTHGVIQTLDRTGQGSYRLDDSRSAFYLPATKNFPLNTEIETSLTFTADRPGPLVNRTAASGDAVTLRQHHSLVQLPDAGYRPREGDPRVGAFGITFSDYATPIDQPLEKVWIARHRLEKRDPAAARSEPVRPLIYYVDRGTPEPIRSALIEGASWWNQAFEAAGFENAFRVEVLPEGADPRDIRYHMIHWTHRSTRGWSYGNSVVDPRTGEIIKANVNLGSLRLRQDYLLGSGLVPPHSGQLSVCDVCGGPEPSALAQVSTDTDPVEMALARVRQLSAHEVGHTLGFAHNFAASTYGRASVMDYPAPLVEIVDGRLDLSNAYDTGIGEYDIFAVKWAYSEAPPDQDEESFLEEIIQEGLASGMRFMSDADARPAGGAHPLAGLWDNGSDPIAMLSHEIRVRDLALASFDQGAIREGEPLAALEEVLLPLYLHHRYQVEAAAKSIGGMHYWYAVRGDQQEPLGLVDPDTQLRALNEVLRTIEPEFLAVPRRILDLIPPPAFGMPSGESFSGHTAPTFDPLAAAASAADLTLTFVLQPERMARLVEFHSRDSRYPGLGDVIDRLLEVTWKASSETDGYLRAVQRTVRRVVLERMMTEADDTDNSPEVRAVLNSKLQDLAIHLRDLETPEPHQTLALQDISRWLERPYQPMPLSAPDAPPGSPIGDDQRR